MEKKASIVELLISAKKDGSFSNYIQIYNLLKREGTIDNFTDQDTLPIRIALVGSCTLAPLAMYLNIKCRVEGFSPLIFVGQYNQYDRELLDPNSELYKFKPDIVFVFVTTQHVFKELVHDPFFCSVSDRIARADEFVDTITNMVARFISATSCVGVVSTLETPCSTILGIHELTETGSLTQLVTRVNNAMIAWAKGTQNAFLLDYNAIASAIGKHRSTDHKMRLYGEIYFSNEVVPHLTDRLLSFVKIRKGTIRKCIVLDVDNTLWGGIVGEDGFGGIKLGPNYPGNAFMEFQRTLLGFYHRGILLAINSRNNPDDALKVLREHPYQLIREEHISAMRINWQDKAANMQEIAQELNIGLNSLVFIDDDIHNCELIRSVLPEILTIHLPPDTSCYSQLLLGITDLETGSLTSEDKMRGIMYAQERQRREAKLKIDDYQQFLRELKLKAKILSCEDANISRVAQLTQRTNQFNTTTRRYTEEQLLKFVNEDQGRIFVLECSDKYGDYGIVGVLMILPHNTEWLIHNMLLSCRVLGRGFEEAFLAHVAGQAKSINIKTLVGEFITTAKNKPASDFFTKMGFEKNSSLGKSEFFIANADNIADRLPDFISIETLG